ncbi:MAG: dual specificity protein phosphatase family protein [Bacteroidota bacterium]
MKIYWLNHESVSGLGMTPRPKGYSDLEHEIQKLKSEGVTYLVSALTKQEINEFGLRETEVICREQGIIFFHFPILDMQIPDSKIEYLKLVKKLSSLIEENQKLVVHCRQGIGRSSLLAAGILMNKGLSLEKTLKLLKESRGRDVPETRPQLSFLKGVEESIFWA